VLYIFKKDMLYRLGKNLGRKPPESSSQIIPRKGRPDFVVGNDDNAGNGVHGSAFNVRDSRLNVRRSTFEFEVKKNSDYHRGGAEHAESSEIKVCELCESAVENCWTFEVVELRIWNFELLFSPQRR
jgi:hypothetical protein